MLGLHEHRESRWVGPMEKGLVRLQRAVGGQTETPQSRAGKLHGRLWAGGDEIAVHDRAVVDVVVPPAYPVAIRYSAAALVWRRLSRRPARARPAVAPQMAATESRRLGNARRPRRTLPLARRPRCRRQAG